VFARRKLFDFRVIPLLWWVGVVPGCILGGQTGEAERSACNRALAVAPDQVSSLGYSATNLLARFGGTRTADIPSWDDGFWAALGIDPAPSTPVLLTLSMAAGTGPTFDDQCEHQLSVSIVVSLDAADSRLKLSGPARLRGTFDSAEVTAEFADAQTNELRLTLEAQWSDSGVQGALLAGAKELPQRPTATFRSSP
jgi:hypothetical protein